MSRRAAPFGRTAARATGGPQRDSGQVGVLIIGYLLISLLVVTVVLAVTAVYIEHKKLLSVADGAALAAADDYSIDVGGGGGEGGPTAPLPVLQGAGVEQSAAGYLAATGADARFEQLSVDPATGAPDGRTARVVLTAVVRPPIINGLLPAGIRIAARADARAQLVR
ncbi:pilus assembly protein TadG-related protein [uncultured Arthrobacter sp.]|uniref:pilus assembly protein TadG-related protein n=1 Tax=uncultured Arthrobacter sp. TaxID=114050 RepID=UPI0026241B93|nr:pilus assembly protein TadG-related protein [uncultured Arthrobacter sp.]